MGKKYTFIHKDHKNTKVLTSDLGKYLNSGWELGNWNQEELNKKSGAGVKNFYSELKENGEYEKYSNQRNSKISNTLKDFWGNTTIEYKEKREKKKSESRNNWTIEEKQLYHEKMSEAAIEQRKLITKSEYKERSKKGFETRKANHTMNTSSFEEKLYKLLISYFSVDDVIREYCDDTRYPFHCDFYIKSKDLFIELNLHPSHNNHPYDENNKDDVAEKELLIESNTDWNNMIVDVWTKRDVEKLSFAIKNNLNYVTIYTQNQFNKFCQKIKVMEI